jgi:hypothetical protein
MSCKHTHVLTRTERSGFIDFVFWGHEHECRVNPEVFSDMYITQPGSSVATSLVEVRGSDGQVCNVAQCAVRTTVSRVHQFYLQYSRMQCSTVVCRAHSVAVNSAVRYVVSTLSVQYRAAACKSDVVRLGNKTGNRFSMSFYVESVFARGSVHCVLPNGILSTTPASMTCSAVVKYVD